MKKFINTLLVSAFILGPITLSHAQKAKEVRNLDYYHSVKVSGSYKVHLVVGEPGSVSLEGAKPSTVSTSVKNGTLYVGSKAKIGLNYSRGSTTVIVPIGKVKTLTLSGSGKISNDGTLRSEKLKILLTGSGKINLNVNADTIESSVSGSGGITLSGNMDKATFSLAGSGVLRASELEADAAVANISGSGSIHVYASESFRGNVSGSGRIQCYGDPVDYERKVSGSGNISFVD